MSATRPPPGQSLSDEFPRLRALRPDVVPVLLGGGPRLLPDGVSGAWNLASSTRMPYGALGLHYQRR